jgi:hypothetical protein
MPQPPRHPERTAETVSFSAAPFCHVEKRGPDGSTHYVVHTQAPRFVVEVEHGGSAGQPGVIRRVCVPNSWVGDYHRCGRLLAAAVAQLDPPPSAPLIHR